MLSEKSKEELKTRYKVDIITEQNEKLKRQNDFLNQENHRLNSIEWFHTHRCREDEIKKLEGEINKLKNSIKKFRRINEENSKNQ